MCTRARAEGGFLDRVRPSTAAGFILKIHLRGAVAVGSWTTLSKKSSSANTDGCKHQRCKKPRLDRARGDILVGGEGRKGLVVPGTQRMLCFCVFILMNRRSFCKQTDQTSVIASKRSEKQWNVKRERCLRAHQRVNVTAGGDGLVNQLPEVLGVLRGGLLVVET